MGLNLSQKLIEAHLEKGVMRPNSEVGLRIDQTLTQDATGTLVMLELESMGLERVTTELSVQYIDHNLLQVDYKNADDHLFLRSACNRFGLWYSRPGNGVSHPLHQENFGIPGKTLLGSDSHTPAAGAMGMLAIGAGGVDVAMAMAGEPFYVMMPKIMGIELRGRLSPWVSAKDVILEVLRRLDVDGGKGYILEYYGSGLDHLSAMDRHVIANMGTETGALTTVFPSDEETLKYMTLHGRAEDWAAWRADESCNYDAQMAIDLNLLEPLIALPSSPGKVKKVSDMEGLPIYQSYVGSSANPGFRDFAIVAEVFADKNVHDKVSLDINPSTRHVLQNLIQSGHLGTLVEAGARIHQPGCNGCIGMGQAPATGRNSLRTVPRNFPGRSGTKEDSVYLVSPETAAASALRGRITDPRRLEMAYPQIFEPESRGGVLQDGIWGPPPAAESSKVLLVKGPNIGCLPDFQALPEKLELPIILKLEDDISTDEILPAGAEVLPYRSNIERISDFCFYHVDENYSRHAKEIGNHCIVAGDNYGQGSSREHAALAPRYLGLRAVIAKSFARIHRQNLINFGVLPLELVDPTDWERLQPGGRVELTGLRELFKSALLPAAAPIQSDIIQNEVLTASELVLRPDLGTSSEIQLSARYLDDQQALPLRGTFSNRHAEILLAGGITQKIKSHKC